MIFSQDLNESKIFYNEILSIPIKQDLSEELGMLIMESKGIIFTIHSGYQKSLDNTENSRTCIAFSVNDIEELKNKLKKRKIEFVGETQKSPIHEYQMIKDPSGNIIEIARYFE